MARKPNSYWEKRSTKMMEEYEKYTEKTIDRLIEIYEQTQKNIKKSINTVYKNYSKNGVLSKEALDVLLNKEQSKVYHDNLLKVIKTLPNSDFRKKLLTKYNAPAYAYRISRLEALKMTTEEELIKLASAEEKITKEVYQNIIQDGYNKTIFEIQKGIGLNFSFADLDNKTVNLMLTDGWYKGDNFSSRIWGNRERLGKYISTNLVADSLAGKSPVQSARELQEMMQVGRFQATRLVRTEVNHFANESEMLAYEECGIERYRFIATLDAVTCVHCAKLDNKVFYIKEKKTGVNFPPIHPFDRCTTVAEFDDGSMEEMQRRARDPKTGQNYILDKNISYEEWKKQIDDKYGKGTLDIEHKKYENIEKDKEQLKRYKNILGDKKELQSIEIFQNFKYNDTDGYKIMKNYYRGVNGGTFPDDLTYEIYKNNLTTDNWQAVGFNPNKLEQHVTKHGKDFGITNKEDYQAAAVKFMNEKIDGDIEGFNGKNGFVFKYDKANNIFGDSKPNGITETFFKPKDGYQYWKEQVEKYGK